MVHKSPNSGSKENHISMQSENENDMSYGSSVNDNLIRSGTNSDAASATSIILQADHSSINSSSSAPFSGGRVLNEYYYNFSKEDLGNLMESVEAFLSWDECNNLEDVFNIGDD